MVTRSLTMNTRNMAAGAASSDNEGTNDSTTFLGDDRNARYHRASDHDLHKDAIMLATAALAHTTGPQQRQQQQQQQQHEQEQPDQARSPQAAAASIGLQQREEHRSSDEEYYEGSPGPPQESLLMTPHAFRTDSLHNNNDKTARGVPHIYHDYSQVPDVDTYVRKKTGGVTQPFPEKLHAMLHDIENNDEYQRIVQWLPHGRAFIVRNPKDFTEIIMPKYFKQTKLTSFQRQLNLYGFRRITQGTDAGAYYHELFLKGRPGLCQRMNRQKVKGTGHKQPADARTEPNFYQMPVVEQYRADSTTTPKFFSAVDVYQSSHPASSPVISYSNPPTTPNYTRSIAGISSRIPPYVLESPASPGLHDAAHLLHGIASGSALRRLSLPDQTSLGPSAETSSSSAPSNEPQHPGQPTIFLQPRFREEV